MDEVVHDVSQHFNQAAQSPVGSHGHHRAGFPGVASPSGMPAQQHQQQQPGPPHPNGPAPPASAGAIRQLETIRIDPEDLIYPGNRECSVCFEEINLDDVVIRMPCAHIYHTHCIKDWLSNHGCTCPDCRYELATDNPQYEAGRTERMKTRKPRYARHELNRMSVRELKALNRRPTSAPKMVGAMEKGELIQLLIDQEQIDFIRTPEPVEYKQETLDGMKIGELKRTMNDNGVFFRPEDALEKSDMLAIFQNSGQLILIAEESAPPMEFTSASTLESPNCDSPPATPMRAPFSSVTSLCNSATGYRYLPTVETVMDESDDEDEQRSKVAKLNCDGRTPLSPEVLFAQQHDNFPSTRQVRQEYERTNNIEHSHGSTVPQGEDPSGTFQNYTVQHLQRLARDTNIDLSSCSERQEMVNLLVNAGIQGTNDDPSALSPHMFSTWSVSQLRAVASEANIDLSLCTDKEAVVGRLLLESSSDRPYLREYLRTLSPYTKSSLSELRGNAQELQVDISDCLEKDEIIQRLITRGQRYSGTR